MPADTAGSKAEAATNQWRLISAMLGLSEPLTGRGRFEIATAAGRGKEFSFAGQA
jgi:hypothetical protein